MYSELKRWIEIKIPDLSKKKNKISENGILLSTTPDEKVTLDPVSGSLYTEIIRVVNKKLKDKGDWIWLKDGMEMQKDLKASEVEIEVKR